jgi:nitrogen fixation protein NifB
MTRNIKDHPCFNKEAKGTYGRIHLPVAPKCNVQCNFCNRKYDCVNESRPGVTSVVLTPEQASIYLDYAVNKMPYLKVVGIAGPGDPFANPVETMTTFKRVHEKYPDMLLCVATNGLNIVPYLDELKDVDISHVSVTVNAIDPKVGARVYSWVRYKKKRYAPEEGAEILWNEQRAAIRGLKERGIVVKVNTIIIPGVNDSHIKDIARKMSEMDVDILNCIPLFKTKDTVFENIDEPSHARVAEIRKEAGAYISQMTHCERCRADAVGLLGARADHEMFQKMKECEAHMPVAREDRPRIAVASMEGVLINQHLGEATSLNVYEYVNGEIKLEEVRVTPPAGRGAERWQALAQEISDCSFLLVSGIGDAPRRTLEASGVLILVLEGLIDEALKALFNKESVNHLIKRERTVCSGGCSTKALGCM